MVKVAAIFVLAVGLAVTVKANCGNDNGKGNGCAEMPEPSVLPELVLSLAGVGGLVVWQRTRRTKQ